VNWRKWQPPLEQLYMCKWRAEVDVSLPIKSPVVWRRSWQRGRIGAEQLTLMSRLTIDTATLAKLQGLSEPVDFCDEQGCILEHFVPYLVAEWERRK
jgi:hypothetical protein